MTTQLTYDEKKFVDGMRNASDQYDPFTNDEVQELIKIVDRLDRAYDALRRGYYPGEPAAVRAPTPSRYTLATCGRCKGKGNFKCPNCTGRGEVSDAYGNDYMCPACKGEGREDCLQCKGTGKMEVETPAAQPDAQP